MKYCLILALGTHNEKEKYLNAWISFFLPVLADAYYFLCQRYFVMFYIWLLPQQVFFLENVYS